MPSTSGSSSKPGAHFYRSLQLDAHGNPINKRNAWSTRSVAYVRLVPPGAADTIHYRLDIPPDAGDKIVLRPGTEGDVYDKILHGRTATVERIYRGFDERVYLGVTVDDDPGQDLLRETGRFLFFFADEVEPVG